MTEILVGLDARFNMYGEMSRARLIGVGLLAAVLVGALALAPSTGGGGGRGPYRVLVFSATEGYRHESIPAGLAAIRALGARNGFAVDATERESAFRDRRLRRYAAVIWLSTTGDVLGERAQAAFERYVGRGGGYVGVHSAADTEYGWPWYGRLVGARFLSHTAIQTATVRVAGRSHPSTRRLPGRWQRTDEWYDYRSNPRGRVRVLATLDEGTYSGGRMGADHPIAWCHAFGGGRAWYTGGGHTAESYAEPAFRSHLLGGIRWAAGRR